MIKKIVLHHSITPRDFDIDKSISSFNNTHKERLHPQENSLGYHIAYHYVIWWLWDVIQTRGIDEVWYHASNWKVNNESVGICLTGNFDEEKPNEKQLKALWNLLLELENEHDGVNIHFHNEFSSKSCPWTNLTVDIIEPYLKRLKPDTISTIYRQNKIDISSWVVKFKLMNYNDDMHKFKTIIMLQNAFGYIAKVMNPVQYVPTKYTDEAQIQIYFAHPWDEILPAPFKKWSLGYWVAPVWPHWWKIFINDSLDWSNWLKEWFFWLIKLIVHEGRHVHNIWHSTQENDIMYELYKQWDDVIHHTPETIAFIREFYNLPPL